MIVSGLMWLLTWPLVIVASYFLIRLALKYHEAKLDEKDSEKTEPIEWTE